MLNHVELLLSTLHILALHARMTAFIVILIRSLGLVVLVRCNWISALEIHNVDILITLTGGHFVEGRWEQTAQSGDGVLWNRVRELNCKHDKHVPEFSLVPECGEPLAHNTFHH